MRGAPSTSTWATCRCSASRCGLGTDAAACARGGPQTHLGGESDPGKRRVSTSSHLDTFPPRWDDAALRGATDGAPRESSEPPPLCSECEMCRELTQYWPALWTIARAAGVEPTNHVSE